MFGPKRTLKSVMQELEAGLRSGEITLRDPSPAEVNGSPNGRAAAPSHDTPRQTTPPRPDAPRNDERAGV